MSPTAVRCAGGMQFIASAFSVATDSPAPKAEFVIPDGVRFVRPALVVGKDADVSFDALRISVND